MGHDQHFLERLDRVHGAHMELALGLYRDHELVRAILIESKLPESVDRVALALDDGGNGPHVVLARDGGFVTCLGEGMSTGGLPVITRARLDKMAMLVERVRDGLAFAKQRGVTDIQLIRRFEIEAESISREDFVAASALVGPAVPLLLGIYLEWAKTLDIMYPKLFAARWPPPKRKVLEEGIVRGAWAMAHSAMLLLNTASREWVRDWAQQPGLDKVSPWSLLVWQSGYPFVVRAAWLAARMGKPFFAAYKARYLEAVGGIEVREAGWGLACMGLRHAALRAEAFRTLRAPHIAILEGREAPRESWAEQSFKFFHEVADILDAKEETLRAEGEQLGRDLVLVRAVDIPEGSRWAFRKREDVPDDMVKAGLFSAWLDGNSGERWADLMLLGIVGASRAQAEDFYYPAAFLHAMGDDNLAENGQAMAEWRRKLHGIGNTVRHEAERPGRNDPCHCGSGKKFKKCHGR
jgi:hypothetical protein